MNVVGRRAALLHPPSLRARALRAAVALALCAVPKSTEKLKEKDGVTAILVITNPTDDAVMFKVCRVP